MENQMMQVMIVDKKVSYRYSNWLCAESIDLADIDRFSNYDYRHHMNSVMQRESMLAKKKRAGIFKSAVSGNRNRYEDGEFNLDLTYITPRVIAMGLPATGIHSFFRNSQQDVIRYF